MTVHDVHTVGGDDAKSPHELLLPLNLRELEQAIVAPAERIGLTFRAVWLPRS